MRPSRKRIPNDIRQQVYERAEGRCHYCDVPLVGPRAFTIDHVTPVRLGGSNDPENLVAACRRCNSMKGWRHPEMVRPPESLRSWFNQAHVRRGWTLARIAHACGRTAARAHEWCDGRGEPMSDAEWDALAALARREGMNVRGLDRLRRMGHAAA